MQKVSGQGIHQPGPGSIPFQQMPLRLVWIGKPLLVIPINDLLMPLVFLGGEIILIMAPEWPAICLFTFFQAFILSPIRMVQIKFILPADCVTGKTEERYRMYCWERLTIPKARLIRHLTFR